MARARRPCCGSWLRRCRRAPARCLARAGPAAPAQQTRIRRRLGYLPQELGFCRGFTASEFVDYIAVLKEWTHAAWQRLQRRRVAQQRQRGRGLKYLGDRVDRDDVRCRPDCVAHRLRRPVGTLATYSNLNHSTGYLQKSFDLSAFKGKSVTLTWKGVEDSSLQTSFFLDDTAVNVTS